MSFTVIDWIFSIIILIFAISGVIKGFIDRTKSKTIKTPKKFEESMTIDSKELENKRIVYLKNKSIDYFKPTFKFLKCAYWRDTEKPFLFYYAYIDDETKPTFTYKTLDGNNLILKSPFSHTQTISLIGKTTMPFSKDFSLNIKTSNTENKNNLICFQELKKKLPKCVDLVHFGNRGDSSIESIILTNFDCIEYVETKRVQMIGEHGQIYTDLK